MKFKIFIAALIAALTALTYFPETPARAASAKKQEKNSISLAQIPEKYLEEQELELYRLVLKNVISISEGRQSAEAFYIDMTTPFPSKMEYENAVEKVMFFIDNYTPEYTFWKDSSGYLVYDKTRCGIIYGISPAYQAQGNENRIDPDRLKEAKIALANAQAIADKYSGKSDYEKIIGYVEEICSLNVYNDAAADGLPEYSQKNIDPWKLVYVFDGDLDTNVVCAGYANAFQYLCGLGGIECHYVSGTVNERHGWNIVELDGESYFVDVTFCDGFTEKDIKRYHPYVLNNVVSNARDGFTTYFMYSGTLSSDSNSYKYADDEMKYLPESLRTISTKAYRKGSVHFTFLHFLLILLAAGAIFYFVKKKRGSGDY